MCSSPSGAQQAAIASRSRRDRASKYVETTSEAVLGIAATLPSRPMRKPTREPAVGRGEKVIPGVWRLRLPLPWPGIPHCNAWAIASGDGIVLVDTGMHEPGSLAHLERALDQVHLKLEHVRLLACTHAHSDHYGQAAPIRERAGCDLWMHPNHEHMTQA